VEKFIERISGTIPLVLMSTPNTTAFSLLGLEAYQIQQTLSVKLTWSHYCELLNR
jgi:hypothetical protein